MEKIKILWMSNKVLSDNDRGGTGTWLTAMAKALLETGEVELSNISHGSVARLTRHDFGQLSQWIIPSNAMMRYEKLLPPKRLIEELNDVVEAYAPNLIHVWGTEMFWGLLTARKVISKPSLLEMQGIKWAIARVYAGGLSFQEQLACIGLKEILRRSTIPNAKSQFKHWGQTEREIVAGHDFITVQSKWLEAQVQGVNDHCKIYFRDFPLQAPFYHAEQWKQTNAPIIFCSTSYPSPFKGLHVAIRTTALLKKHFPNIQLNIAGAYQKPGLRQDGFVAWLNREARKLGVSENLRWLGPLTVSQIIAELQNCAVALLPTFVEGYGLSLAEAMYLGTPTVVSYTGGTSFLVRDEESALFFPAGDVEMCAYQIERLMEDNDLANHLSLCSRQIGLRRNDCGKIVRDQINIYRQVLGSLP